MKYKLRPSYSMLEFPNKGHRVDIVVGFTYGKIDTFGESKEPVNSMTLRLHLLFFSLAFVWLANSNNA